MDSALTSVSARRACPMLLCRHAALPAVVWFILPHCPLPSALCITCLSPPFPCTPAALQLPACAATGRASC